MTQKEKHHYKKPEGKPYYESEFTACVSFNVDELRKIRQLHGETEMIRYIEHMIAVTTRKLDEVMRRETIYWLLEVKDELKAPPRRVRNRVK